MTKAHILAILAVMTVIAHIYAADIYLEPDAAKRRTMTIYKGETQTCLTHGYLVLRYAENVPPSSETTPYALGQGIYLNNFEGCFKVKIANVWNFYTVWAESGPFADPDGLLKVLDHVRDSHTQFGQWWSYTVPGDRYRDLDSLPNAVPLPEP